MIGIVLVSHSYDLAQGAEILSRTMAGQEVRIAAAGGLDTPDNAIGTDPVRVLQAIETVYSDDGVLIFADMGSALLSAEFAVQMLEEEKQSHVIISDAPFIEGAVCAAVQARLNTPLPLVLKELKTALLPKQEQLGTALAEADNTSPMATAESVKKVESPAQTANVSEPAEKIENQTQTAPAIQTQPLEKECTCEPVKPEQILQFTVSNTYGIHARPAARITALAGKYPTLTVTVKKKDSPKTAVSALSVNSIALLGIRQGDGIVFFIKGDNPESFCAELAALAETQFGDAQTASAAGAYSVSEPAAPSAMRQTAAIVPTSRAKSYTPAGTADGCIKTSNPFSQPVQPTSAEDGCTGLFEAALHQNHNAELQKIPPEKLSGLIGSFGIALGAARFLQRKSVVVPKAPTGTPDTEWQQFLDAAAAVKKDLQAASVRTKANTEMLTLQTAEQAHNQKDASSNAAAIFEAHILILGDPLLSDEVKNSIYTHKTSAAAAWKTAMQTLQQSYRESNSPYLRERVCDLADIEYLLLSKLLKIPEQGLQYAEGIIIAEDLTPQQTAQLSPTAVKGICTVKGSPTSHTAILARSFGIPALMGMGSDLLTIQEGTPLILDAERGVLLIHPDTATEQKYRSQVEEQLVQARTASEHRHEPAVTRGGKTICVAANIGSAADARAAVENGADGVGLLRTEFLFLNRSAPPSEEEQYTAYCEIARIMDGLPLIIRTLDAGGDKEIPYLGLPKDENPFLGYRAIRISLTQKAFFRTQLRAIIRAAQSYPVKLMFPMIASIDELDTAKTELNRAKDELRQRSIDVSKQFPVGMMMEVPSAALLADQFAKKVDFFSIGTNDLTQYTLAAERGNSRIANLYDTSHPAVMQLIKEIIAAAHRAGKPVGVCGEFAADREGAKILCDFGIDELSVAVPAIPRVKELVRSVPKNN